MYEHKPLIVMQFCKHGMYLVSTTKPRQYIIYIKNDLMYF